MQATRSTIAGRSNTSARTILRRVPQVDADGDGQDKLFEWTAGVVPTSATSLFKLEVRPVAGQPTQKNFVFSPRLADRTYEAEFRESLSTNIWETLSTSAQSDFGNERTITDLRAIESNKFYRIQITKP